MSKKVNHRAFLDAIRARNGLSHYDLGGGVDLASGVQQLPQVPGGPVTQGGLLGAITPQNQFQAQLAPTTQLNYAPLLNQAANQSLAGYGAGQGNIASQQALEQQFLREGMGQGPNPAQAALAQNTAANVAAQSALMAGQRGASSNVGLIARQSAQQGAAAQQAAVGQAATLQAQQQLAAQQAAANQQAQIGQQITAQQGASNQLFGAGAGALGTQNLANISNYAQAQNVNAQTAQQNANKASSGGEGILGAIGGILGAIFAEGGEVKGYDQGGDVKPSPTPTSTSFPPEQQEELKKVSKGFFGATAQGAPLPQPKGYYGGGAATGALGGSMAGTIGVPGAEIESPSAQGAQSKAGQFLQSLFKGMSQPGDMYSENLSNLGSVLGQGISDLIGGQSKAKGGKILKGEEYAAKGKEVPGKAKAKGDNLKNDTVPAMLSPGEIIIPRSVAQHPDAANKAAQFVASIKAKGNKRKK